MSRAKILLALPVSALIALLPQVLVGRMTSGSWEPSRVRWQDVALVFPMVVAVKSGLSRGAALAVSFRTYWSIAFAFLVCYIPATTLPAVNKNL